LQVKKLAKPGRHGDGGGLYLAIDGKGRKRWLFLYRDRRTKRLREMGLGGFADTTLAAAREKAQRARDHLKAGRDPIAARALSQASQVPTFGEVADAYLAAREGQWRNAKHRWQWNMSLERYAKPLRALPVDEVAVEHVLAVLRPLWAKATETASRVRGRIERVLNAAKAAGHRSGENPAAWRGHLENLLPPLKTLSRGHHRALPWSEVPAFLARLRQRTSVAALALEFAILTAARSGEVRGAG
jgi:integrase